MARICARIVRAFDRIVRAFGWGVCDPVVEPALLGASFVPICRFAFPCTRIKRGQQFCRHVMTCQGHVIGSVSTQHGRVPRVHHAPATLS